ncbi:Ankrd17 [Symbiodinium sp. CCMP2592]|nr:Ankrd17 [Symbiodinium sp. CCMP2592]
MLRVWTVSGEELAALPVEEQSDVRSLKRHLQQFHGLPRFRQRLLCNGSSLDDDARLVAPVDLQIVLLPFCHSAQEQVEELIDLAKRGSLLQVEEVLQRPQDPNLAVPNACWFLQSPCDSANPLLAAVENGDVPMVSLLLEARASVTEEIADVAASDLQLVSVLLDAGGPGTGRCLYHASSQGRVELVRRLLEAGADESYLHFEETRFKFHSTSPRRSQPVGTPLSVASGQRHLEVVQLLLEAGADQHEATLAGTPLYVACSAGHTQIVQLLLEAGADEHFGTETETPLYVTSLKGHAEAARCLLNSSADVNTGNGKETPLYAAASRGHVETVHVLLQAGADRHRGRVADMPLHAAKCNGHTEVVHLLQGTWQAAISFQKLFRVMMPLTVCAVILGVRWPSAWKLARAVFRHRQSWIGRMWTRMLLNLSIKAESAAEALEKTIRDPARQPHINLTSSNMASRCDDVPTTTAGRLVAICTFYAGVVLVAIMLTIVGGAFAAHYPKWIKNNKGKDTGAVSFRKSTVIPSGENR